MRVISTLVVLLLGSVPVRAQTESALRAAGWLTDFDQKAVDLVELEVNIPRDAIPAIDRPQFESAAQASAWLADNEPVVLVQIGTTGRAYPLQIMMWHEIANDTLNGVPISVTFCPLCYSAVAFDRRLDGRVLTLGVSGMLRHSDMIMFDRETHSMWQQLTGEALVGKHVGSTLTAIPAQIISFEQFRNAYPDGHVLSRETGMDRPYGQNPYAGYDDIDARPWLYDGPEDGRLPPMEKVVGIIVDGNPVAYGHRTTRKEGVIHDRIAGTDVVVFHVLKGAASALDDASIAASRDLGSTGVFLPVVGGRRLTFEMRRRTIRDKETNSVWRIDGVAVEGPLAGSTLSRLVHVDAFSFAWFVLHPETDVYGQ